VVMKQAELQPKESTPPSGPCSRIVAKTVLDLFSLLYL
jgi:hypothetical protein